MIGFLCINAFVSVLLGLCGNGRLGASFEPYTKRHELFLKHVGWPGGPPHRRAARSSIRQDLGLNVGGGGWRLEVNLRVVGHYRNFKRGAWMPYSSCGASRLVSYRGSTGRGDVATVVSRVLTGGEERRTHASAAAESG